MSRVGTGCTTARTSESEFISVNAPLITRNSNPPHRKAPKTNEPVTVEGDPVTEAYTIPQVALMSQRTLPANRIAVVLLKLAMVVLSTRNSALEMMTTERPNTIKAGTNVTIPKAPLEPRESRSVIAPA